jgi:tetratricopeptide (TPR) repeat protein
MRVLFLALAAALSALPAYAVNWQRANDRDWVDLDTIVDRDGLTFADWGQGAKDPAGGYTLPPTTRAAAQLAYKCSTAEPYVKQPAGAFAAARNADLNDALFRLVCDAPARRPALAVDQRPPLWATCNSNEVEAARAIEACNAFIEAAGEEPATLSQVLERRSRLKYGTDKDDAIGDATRAIRFAPNAASPWKTRGIFTFYGRKDSKKALEDISKAITLGPDSDGYFIRAIIYKEGFHDFQRALADLDKAIGLAPRDWQSLKERCWIRAILNRDLDKAEADCRLSLEIFPRWFNTYVGLGLVFLKRGDQQAALDAYEIALKGDPDQIGGIYGRGIARLRLGKVTEGQADIAAATARDKDIAAEYERYGVKP